MTKVDLDKAFLPPAAINWPGGGEVTVTPINFRQQRTAALIEKGELDAYDALPALVAELVPSKTRDQIETELDLEKMWLVIHWANRNVQLVESYLAERSGNAVAGAAPASPPPSPVGTSAGASVPAAGIPCGAS